ncbi:hypothetical protein BGZ51_009099 [Haplosporangium sp. Z 767]|nr:hypothetical protein BGZ51_009099 [Haplosporangium sp. Z 767]
MAKRKSASRKTRQTAAHSSANEPRASSKHVSASPSVVSSPSPQPQDLVQRRRKNIPVRSPAQGDPSKGIVFAFRIKNDSDLSMAVDILSYDQVPEEGQPVAATVATTTTTTLSTSEAESITTIAVPAAATAVAEATEGSQQSEAESPRVNIHSQVESTVVSRNLKVAGEHWSSDPTSYLSNNVVDLSRNVLILHSRKPLDSSTSASSPLSFHPYHRRPSAPSRSMSMSQPSTPPSLTDSGSTSSASSSPSSSPSSPTMFPTSAGEKEDLYMLDPPSSLPSPSSLPLMSLNGLKPQASRMLSVRGLGTGERKMQVYLV